MKQFSWKFPKGPTEKQKEMAYKSNVKIVCKPYFKVSLHPLESVTLFFYNVTRFARNVVKWDFFKWRYFKPLWFYFDGS